MPGVCRLLIPRSMPARRRTKAGRLRLALIPAYMAEITAWLYGVALACPDLADGHGAISLTPIHMPGSPGSR